MPISAPPTIPQITDPSTFATRAQDWVVWQANELYPALEDSATVLSLSTSATSTTSNTIGTGSKSFTVETGKGYLAGQSLSIAYTTTPTNRMFAVVTSYNSGTGALVVNVQAFEGSGTFAAWSIALAFNGVINTGQIANEAVTLAKIARVGTAGQVLTSGGAGAAPSYTTITISDKIQPITASVESNALTITLNPTVLDFRSATLTSGTVNTRTVAAAISLVISSGSTLGTTSAIQSRIAVLAIDNAGTVELAAVNVAGGTNLDETGVITTIAEGGAGAADSISTIYSTSARSNVPYRVVGYVESTQSTAGTWATSPSTIQGAGGRSLQRVNAICNSVAVSSTSGTSIDFTGIPSWAKRITVMFEGVSTNGTSVIQLQLGDSGGIETTGYFGANVNTTGGVATSALNNGSGFLTDNAGSASYIRHGTMILTNLSGNLWTLIGALGNSDGGRANTQSGSKTLSSTLDRIRITTVNGTDAFDAGSINILWE